MWVRRFSLSSVNCELNQEFRSFRGKMEEKIFQAVGEQGAAEKESLMRWGRQWYRTDECGALRWTQTSSAHDADGEALVCENTGKDYDGSDSSPFLRDSNSERGGQKHISLSWGDPRTCEC